MKLPMIVKVDSKSTVDQFNSWSVGGRTRHAEAKMMWLRELKEDGIIDVVWQCTDDNVADLFTKNLGGPAFEKHTGVYVGHDEYMGELTGVQRKGC